MFSPSQISFRKLDFVDLPLLHKWLNEPHVHEWYDRDKQNSLKEVTDEYTKYITGEEKVYGFLVCYENKPFAYIQWYPVNDWEEFAKTVGYDESAAGVDLFIGEIGFVGKGMGTLMLKKFLTEIVFAQKGITRCIIDPEPDNKRAIRAYEKVGFKYIRTLQVPEEQNLTYLMEIKKEDFIL
ncbi:MAG TPA: GNAT family N-acetyltransferase [Xanthomonadales bacterium]|nr:GNAT family N-acetyltransferase [Xanthomonadales bacterium]